MSVGPQVEHFMGKDTGGHDHVGIERGALPRGWVDAVGWDTHGHQSIPDPRPGHVPGFPVGTLEAGQSPPVSFMRYRTLPPSS